MKVFTSSQFLRKFHSFQSIPNSLPPPPISMKNILFIPTNKRQIRKMNTKKKQSPRLFHHFPIPFTFHNKVQAQTQIAKKEKKI